MQAMNAPYPTTLTFDPPEKVANWRPLVHWLLVIPHWVVLYLLGIVSQVIGFVSWIVILFTGKLPDGFANFQVMYLRYSTRTATYLLFMREEYPPFTFDTTSADPGDDPRVHLEVAPELLNRNRVTVFFRLILAIPQFIALFFVGIGAGFAVIAAFFVVLFTGAWPPGLRDFVVGVMRWNLRVQAYLLLLTDIYPPFSLD